ncbi:cytochrome bc1 complex Rieske iron-sulfur subunit [Flaviflexus equikiangi]|uniref:Cytochrome bc1 complex Rieske iron-sulfur subunit n=1 Tax=Flaviflexus equikiangi TaxID=2758573 RepID=A0ABS2TF32_9ACTO|nr:Rieske 2Fe-2S domain-containing protein [Flaviflexus equikiangi]MBM9433261.1 Rieske (2Fe-2S) protein [Flaviflexus equikiangi]
MSKDIQPASTLSNIPEERFENPGLPPHVARKNESRPGLQKLDSAIVTAVFSLSALASLTAVVLYFVLPDYTTLANIRLGNLVLGLGLAIGFGGIGFAAIYWAKALMNDEEQVEERHTSRTSPEDQAEAMEILRQGVADSGIARRPFITAALGGALALVPLPFIVPLIANLGQEDGWNIGKLKHTMWAKGTRLMTDGPHDMSRPIKMEDVTIGSVFHVIPEGLNDLSHAEGYAEEKAKAVVLLIRLDEKDLKQPENSLDGIVAFSKICTHVGCPVALYEQQTHHLLCPCHQSTFDVADGAKVVFGPAKRPLPQLPITVDDEGYIIAEGDFPEPVGPSYWERKK